MSENAAPSSDTSELRRVRLNWLHSLAYSAVREQRLASLAAVLAGALLIVQAAAIAWLVQAVLVQRHNVETLWMAFALLALVLLLRSLLNGAAQWLAGRVADAAKQELRAQAYRRLLGKGPLWVRRKRSGELGELLLAHTDALEGYFAGYLPARIESAVVPLLILAVVFPVDWVVGLVLIITAPMIPIFMMLVGWGAEAAGRQQLGELARMGGHFADRLKGLGLLRLYGRGDDELAGIAEAADGVRVRTLKVLRIAFLSSTTLEFFASVSVAMVALYLGLGYLGMISFGTSPSLGAGMFCLLLAPEFYAPLRKLAAHYHDRANALAAAAETERLLEGFHEAAGTAHIEMAESAPYSPELSEERAPLLQVREIYLRPHGAAEDVLQKFSFELAAGSRMALVGPSGSGKSTLLEALAGWLPPRQGLIKLHPGVRIGYAGQRPYLFHGSIAANLRLADPHASEQRLQVVAEAAQVMRFAARLPQGLDTVIGERGFGLSGGEARRIALARLLLSEPDLLLLDEPTAFLDADTEAELLRTLGVFARGRSVIMATHSVAAMRWADAILALPALAALHEPSRELA